MIQEIFRKCFLGQLFFHQCNLWSCQFKKITKSLKASLILTRVTAKVNTNTSMFNTSRYCDFVIPLLMLILYINILKAMETPWWFTQTSLLLLDTTLTINKNKYWWQLNGKIYPCLLCFVVRSIGSTEIEIWLSKITQPFTLKRIATICRRKLINLKQYGCLYLISNDGVIILSFHQPHLTLWCQGNIWKALVCCHWVFVFLESCVHVTKIQNLFYVLSWKDINSLKIAITLLTFTKPSMSFLFSKVE